MLCGHIEIDHGRFDAGIVYTGTGEEVAYTYGNRVILTPAFKEDRDREAVEDFAYSYGCIIKEGDEE